MHGKHTAEISGAEAKVKSEANSETPVSRDEELVDSSGTSIETEQTKVVASEEKPRAQSTIETDKMKDGETTTNTGTTTDQCSNFGTEEKLSSEATSEAHRITDVKMTSSTGIPVQQSNIATIEEKTQIDAVSDPYPHTIQDMEMGTNNGPPIDQSSSLVAEEKPPEQSSSIGDVCVTANAGIPTDQTQNPNGSTENVVKKSPNRELYEEKSGCNVVSDITQKVTSNGILHPEDKTLFVHEDEAVGCDTSKRRSKLI